MLKLALMIFVVTPIIYATIQLYKNSFETSLALRRPSSFYNMHYNFFLTDSIIINVVLAVISSCTHFSFKLLVECIKLTIYQIKTKSRSQ